MRLSSLASFISILFELVVVYLIEVVASMLIGGEHNVVVFLLFCVVVVVTNLFLIPLCVRRLCNNQKKFARGIFLFRIIYNVVCYIMSMFSLFGMYANPGLLATTEMLQSVIQKSGIVYTVLGYVLSAVMLVLLPIVRALLVKAGFRIFSKNK